MKLELIALLAAVNVGAADWWFFNNTNNEAWFVDKTSIVHNSGTASAWTLSLTNNVIYPSKTKSSKTKFKVDCKQDKMMTVSYVNYDEDQNVIGSGNPRLPTWEEIVPETIGESFRDLVCAPSFDTKRYLHSFDPKQTASIVFSTTSTRQ